MLILFINSKHTAVTQIIHESSSDQCLLGTENEISMSCERSKTSSLDRYTEAPSKKASIV